MTAILMFAVEALKTKYKPGYHRHLKKKKKKSIKLVVEDFSWNFGQIYDYFTRILYFSENFISNIEYDIDNSFTEQYLHYLLPIWLVLL